jgi:ABC-2 type transport system permease protein
MSLLRSHLAAAGAICKRDWQLFISYRMRLVTTVFGTVVSLTLFYYVSRLVRSDKVGSPDDYYAFVVVGIIIFGVLTSTLSTPVATLRAELLAGTFERMVLSPFGAIRSVASLLIFPLLVALATGLISLIFATLIFGLDIRWSTAGLAVPVALLGAVAFAPFGLLMTAAVVLFKQTNAGALFVVSAFSLLAGLYFPVELLPGWIRWASEVQPFTPAVDLQRHLLVDTPLSDSPWVELVKLVMFAAVLLPPSLAVLGAAVKRSRRLGTIIEY